MIEADLYNHVNSSVGALYQNRALSNATFPYTVQRLISKSDAGLGNTRARFQFDVFGQTYGQAKDTAVQVAAAILSFPLGFATYRATEMDLYDPDVDIYRVMIDAIVYYVERSEFG